MTMRCNFASSLALILILLLLPGCGDSMRSTLAPEHQGRIVAISSIGVAGPGTSLATQEFIAQGYNVHDLGASGIDTVESARRQGLSYVAIVDAVDTSQAVWNGFYSFAMRVSNATTGSIVWSASGTFGQGGMFINLQSSSKNAMKAMIADFAKTFPPVKQILH